MFALWCTFFLHFVVSSQSSCAYLKLVKGKVFWCFLGFTHKMSGMAGVFLVEGISRVLAKCPFLNEEALKGCILPSDIPKWPIKPNPATGIAALKLICLPYSSVLLQMSSIWVDVQFFCVGLMQDSRINHRSKNTNYYID